MKRIIQIAALLVVVLIVKTTVSLYPKLRNMSSEYATAQAIRDIEAYARANHGRWPASPADLANKYPLGGEVEVDYSVRSGDLIAEPEKLRDVVRPRSGKFYTYPHYDSQLEGLLTTLRETSHQSGQDPAVK